MTRESKAIISRQPIRILSAGAPKTGVRKCAEVFAAQTGGDFETELDGVVAIRLLRAHLADDAGTGGDNGHSDRSAVFLEDLCHPLFASEDQRHESWNLLIRRFDQRARMSSTPGHAARE